MANDPLSRSRIALAIFDHGFEGNLISDDSGRVVAKICAITGATVSATSSLLTAMEEDGEVEVGRGVKRTYSVRLRTLTPKTRKGVNTLRAQRRRMEAELRQQELADAVESPEPQQVAREEEARQSGAASALDADDVAVAILRKVAEILGSEDSDSNQELMLQRIEFLTSERDEARERLAATLEENQRMRQRLSTVGDELRAKSTQIGGLIRERDQLRSNLNRLMKDQSGIVGGEVRKRIEQFMREAPSAKG